MPARVLVAAVAAALVVLLSLRLGDHEACEDARRDVFGSLTGKGALDRADLRTIEARCRGSDALVATAGALRTARDEEGAARLARVAVRRDPESFSAWRALAALSEGDEARRAGRRAAELNPRWARAPALGASPPAGADGEGP